MSRNHCNSLCSKFCLKKTKTILLFRTDLEIIQEAGKNFFWKKPVNCPNCGISRLWGHGFVLRYFAGYASGIWMKRWRCAECHGVHTARPLQYSPGNQYPKRLQIKSLKAKLSGKTFLSEIPRQIQQHWRNLFLASSRQKQNWVNPLSFLKDQLKTGQFELTKRRIYCVTWPKAESPYLRFALTVKRRSVSLE